MDVRILGPFRSPAHQSEGWADQRPESDSEHRGQRSCVTEGRDLVSQLIATENPAPREDVNDAAIEDPAPPETDDSSSDEGAQTDQPPAEQEAPATEQPAENVAQQETNNGGGSALPLLFGRIVGGAIVFGGVVLYRKKQVKPRGPNVPMLSDSEEVRLVGERIPTSIDSTVPGVSAAKRNDVTFPASRASLG